MKRFWIFAGALVVTLGALTLAMMLGSASFDFRRYSRAPAPAGEGDARAADGRPPDAGPRGRGDDSPRGGSDARQGVEREAAARGGKKAAEIREKGARHAETRVYQAGDMLYFVFFDAAGAMRDFTCVSR